MATADMTMEDKRLHRLWSALPDHPVSEEDAHAAILEAAGRYEGDGAWASLQVTTLCLMGAATLTAGTVTRSAEFPVVPELVPGSEAYLDLQNREREQAREREIAAENEAYARRFEQSAVGRQQRELRELVDQQVSEQLEPLKNEIAELRVRLRVLQNPDAMTSLEPAA